MFKMLENVICRALQLLESCHYVVSEVWPAGNIPEQHSGTVIWFC